MRTFISVIILCLTIVSCINIDDDSGTNSEVEDLKVGEMYGGGIVFYIDSTGKHGLIAAESDLTTDGSNLHSWGAQGILLGTNDRNDGQKNLELAKSYDGVSLIKYCSTIEWRGYSDWYLGADNEMAILQENIDIVGGFSGNSNEAKYWTSTELDKDNALGINMVALMGNYIPKTYSYKVRLIRKF